MPVPGESYPSYLSRMVADSGADDAKASLADAQRSVLESLFADGDARSADDPEAVRDRMRSGFERKMAEMMNPPKP